MTATPEAPSQPLSRPYHRTLPLLHVDKKVNRHFDVFSGLFGPDKSPTEHFGGSSQALVRVQPLIPQRYFLRITEVYCQMVRHYYAPLRKLAQVSRTEGARSRT
jgi:hypothetical protein